MRAWETALLCCLVAFSRTSHAGADDAAPPTRAYVSANMTLGGVSTFGATQASQFTTALATVLGVLTTDVSVTSVGGNSSVCVAFAVTTTASAAASLSQTLTVVTGYNAIHAMQRAGLSTCTSVAVSTPSVGAVAPVDAAFGPPVTAPAANCTTAASCATPAAPPASMSRRPFAAPATLTLLVAAALEAARL